MENKEVEILLVEDNEADIEMTLRSLSESNVCNAIQVVRDGREALDLLFSLSLIHISEPTRPY